MYIRITPDYHLWISQMYFVWKDKNILDFIWHASYLLILHIIGNKISNKKLSSRMTLKTESSITLWRFIIDFIAVNVCRKYFALTLSLDNEFCKIYAQTCSCYSSFNVYKYMDQIIRNIYKSSFTFVPFSKLLLGTIKYVLSNIIN